MSDDDNNTPHKTRDELTRTFNQYTQPIIEPIQRNREKIAFYLDTGYEHSKRIAPMFSHRWNKIEQATSDNMGAYHHYRRQFPWEIVTATTALAFISSLPYGMQATTRNSLLMAVGSTLLINPEYLYDQYKFYTSSGIKAKDSSNKATFRW